MYIGVWGLGFGVWELWTRTHCLSTKGPMWGHPVPVLGAISPFLEPFRGRLSLNIDNVSEKLTLRYPHEGPWVETYPGLHLVRQHLRVDRPPVPPPSTTNV